MIVLFLADSVPYLNIDWMLIRIKELHLLDVRNQRKTIFKIQIRSLMLHVFLNEGSLADTERPNQADSDRQLVSLVKEVHGSL
jgi:hypothetical protein